MNYELTEAHSSHGRARGRRGAKRGAALNDLGFASGPSFSLGNADRLVQIASLKVQAVQVLLRGGWLFALALVALIQVAILNVRRGQCARVARKDAAHLSQAIFPSFGALNQNAAHLLAFIVILMSLRLHVDFPIIV